MSFPSNQHRVGNWSKRSLPGAVAAAGLLAAGAFIGSVATGPSAAWGEVRSAAPPQHFASGSQLSLPLLQEISATLQRIDARLARLEAVAGQIQGKKTSAVTP